MTNGGGTATVINKYDEFGIPASTNGGRFGYTGQSWLPELGMNYYKARMYSPTLGRFMQSDPIGYGDGMNMYNYVGSDPVNKVDPTGLAGTVTCITVYYPSSSYLLGYPPATLSRQECTFTGEGPGSNLPPAPPSPPGPPGGVPGVPQNNCPAPSGSPGNVSLTGTLTGVADVMGGFKFTGTLTDTRRGGMSVSFEATGVAVGFAGGRYDVQGTVPGFDALDSTFQISFFNAGYAGFGVSGARISRGDLGPGGAIGEISVSNGAFAPLPAGAATMKFNGGARRSTTSNRFGC